MAGRLLEDSSLVGVMYCCLDAMHIYLDQQKSQTQCSGRERHGVSNVWYSLDLWGSWREAKPLFDSTAVVPVLYRALDDVYLPWSRAGRSNRRGGYPGQTGPLEASAATLSFSYPHPGPYGQARRLAIQKFPPAPITNIDSNVNARLPPRYLISRDEGYRLDNARASPFSRRGTTRRTPTWPP